MREPLLVKIFKYNIDILIYELLLFDFLDTFFTFTLKAINEVRHGATRRLSWALQLEQKLDLVFV